VRTNHSVDDSLAAEKQLVLPSYAKINLGLRVIGRREDGYHDIQTVFQQISLHDTVRLRVRESPGTRIDITADVPGLPTDHRNLAYRAAERILARCPRPVHVEIALQKRIPMGAGLGGGSSNAAVVLLGLAHLMPISLSPEELQDLAVGLGADVPFFIVGGTALAEGIGERLQAIAPVLTNQWIVVVAPPIHIATKWAYANLKIPLTTVKKKINLHRFFLSGDEQVHWRLELINDFERVVFRAFPQLREIKEMLYEKGAVYASLTGSGSAVYGIYHKEVDALAGVACFQQHYPTYLARPVRWGIRELGSHSSNG